MLEPATLPIAPRYTRAVHIYRDFRNTQQSLAGYQVSPLVIETLTRICASLDANTTLRAFSLIGPFGAGKSAFGLFLAHYLQLQPPARQGLLDSLAGDALLTATLPTDLPVLLPILVPGNNSSLRREILRALLNTTQHNTTQHNTTQHNTTQHNTTQHNTTQHNTTQHNTTQHNRVCHS